ncbi:hypothetical protein RB593_002450 [Gaeumannomyces tritici]
MQRGLPERRRIKDVARVVAVSSAKGGVGKSTVAANLALAFARLGHRSGILDTDIFGPSIPTLFNLSEEPRLSQRSIIVTTPHTLAVKDAVKGINMFKKVNVPILGLVQNMSVFRCPHCHGDTAVFGSGDAVQEVCSQHQIDFLGDLPLHPNIGDDAHRGCPTVVAEPDSERAAVFTEIARAITSKTGL